MPFLPTQGPDATLHPHGNSTMGSQAGQGSATLWYPLLNVQPCSQPNHPETAFAAWPQWPGLGQWLLASLVVPNKVNPFP